MTVGFLKRLLKFTNIVAVVAIAWTVWSYLQHRDAMKQPVKPLDFTATGEVKLGGSARIDNTMIPLGSFPKPVVATKPESEGPKEMDLQKAIDKYGTIKGAIVVYPPYGDVKPSILFEYKTPPRPGAGAIQSIEIGQALVTRPHSDPQLAAWGDTENVRFQFVRCEPDPKNPKWTLFVFDVDCDGKRFEKASWKGEVLPEKLKASAGVVRPQQTKSFRDPSLVEPKKTPTGKGPGSDPKPIEVKPVAPVTITTGPVFVSEGGRMVTTESGVDYLRNNYSKVLKEAHTAPYKDKNGKVVGIRIRAIAKESVANSFGVRKNDVIKKVNGTPVSSKSQAVNVVKRLLNKKPPVNIINVEILRAGATKTLSFDTRDPATRRKARDFGK